MLLLPSLKILQQTQEGKLHFMSDIDLLCTFGHPCHKLYFKA